MTKNGRFRINTKRFQSFSASILAFGTAQQETESFGSTTVLLAALDNSTSCLSDNVLAEMLAGQRCG